MFNITSKYFSFFNNKPPAGRVAHTATDVLQVIPVVIIVPCLQIEYQYLLSLLVSLHWKISNKTSIWLPFDVSENLNHLIWVRHYNTPFHCNTPLHWALQEFLMLLKEFLKFPGPSPNHPFLGSKYSVFWGLDFYLYSLTYDNILFTLTENTVFDSSDRSQGNEVARILFSVKNFPKWYLHSPLLHLRQDVECEFTWYAVTNWRKLQVCNFISSDFFHSGVNNIFIHFGFI